ncbi:MAG: hypothetical protein HYV95_05105 [Opitutae bacterium]|nr:hypothetical protein [Opitutae bacterium]
MIGLLLFLGLIIWLNWWTQKKTLANLRALAGRLGLQLTAPPSALGGGGMVSGAQQGRAVRFWTYTTGSGKSRQTWCAVGVRPRAVGGLQFELQRQNFGTKVMEWFGAKEIQVGDAGFDAAWFVQTNQPEFLAAALVPEIREKLMADAADAREGGYKLADGEVRFALRDNFTSEKAIARLEARLPVLHDLADVAEVFAADQPAR